MEYPFINIQIMQLQIRSILNASQIQLQIPYSLWFIYDSLFTYRSTPKYMCTLVRCSKFQKYLELLALFNLNSMPTTTIFIQILGVLHLDCLWLFPHCGQTDTLKNEKSCFPYVLDHSESRKKIQPSPLSKT